MRRGVLLFAVSGMCQVALHAVACPPTPDDMQGATVIQMQRSWAVLAAPADRVIDSKIRVRAPDAPPDDGGIAGASPADVGLWNAPMNFPVIAIHASLLRTGEVLAYARPGADQAKVWNPQTGAFTPVNMGDDIFCSGHAQLADGRVFVAGGNDDGCEFQGIVDTNIFDPVSHTWSRQGNMVDGRWYPTVVTMPDGRLLIFAGLALDCDDNEVCEMFTPSGGVGGGGSLSIVPEGERHIDLYPRMHVLSNGRIAHVGPENSAWTFQLGVGWQFVAWNNHGWRGHGTSVLLPGFTDRIMILGGADPYTNTCEIIDFSQASPHWTYTTPMHYARAHANATILPDKTVLVIGGGQNGPYGSPVLTPELYDPVKATWTELPSHVYGRMYHSTALLLPDGRVLSAGQDNGAGQLTGQIYSPPYLFRGTRPVINSTPQAIAYGHPFVINTPNAASINSVVLMKLANVTHSVTFDQRLVELAFAHAGATSLIASAPPTANRAPPGYYMLIVLNGSNVPSVAKIVRVGTQPSADISGDGAVNVDDLLAVIGAWGPCPAPPAACLADINLSGAVNVDDLLAVIANWG